MTAIILGIESSCDDTAAAVCKSGQMLSNLTANQDVHRQYGGVVPELASRAHQANIVPVIDGALKKAGVTASQLSAVAFTRGPGLLGSLLVGGSFAKALALAINVPLIGVHHMKAHILAHFIDDPKPDFPFICLTVSGGHTQIVLVKDYMQMEVLGNTIDDAAGEAFDKTAKMFGLPYPGGPEIDRLAAGGDPHRFQFARPRVGNLDYSFSGLKTSVLYFLRDRLKEDASFIANNLPDLCAGVQQAVIEMLLYKLKMAAGQTGISHIAIAGGVSANSGLRKALEDQAGALGWKVFIPAMQYCTDNAAMIAMAGYFRYRAGVFDSQHITVSARLPFDLVS